MGIIVVDQSPELFWFVSNALINEEVSLKQIQGIETAERIILQELPSIVILNGDDKGPLTDIFINKMRNHVFARHTMFIVFTSNTSNEFKSSLLMAGATQIFYRGPNFGPSLKFFSNFIKWCLTFKNPNPVLFEYKPSKFDSDAKFTSYGRIGWVSSSHCLIETNVSLNPNDVVECHNSLFSELKISDLKLECIEKNKVGRYYQYSNSILCKILTSDPEKDSKKLSAWIKNNLDISKEKPIKLVYFEDAAAYRDVIKKIIKTNKRYCARGYDHINDISDVLTSQIPHLVLVNRNLIDNDRAAFDKIKKFLKENFCYCVTYSTKENEDVEKYKKDFDFAMHVPATIDIDLLESMIKKLEEKIPRDSHEQEEKVYFNKLSAYSRMSLHADAKITEIAISGAGITLPFELTSFSACEISSPTFKHAKIDYKQFFRSFSNKTSVSGVYHQMIFMGQTVKDNQLVKEAIENITLIGFDKWLSDEKKD